MALDYWEEQVIALERVAEKAFSEYNSAFDEYDCAKNKMIKLRSVWAKAEREYKEAKYMLSKRSKELGEE